MLTPVGRVLRKSSHPSDRPAIFAAQFSLSHWLLAYPIAGWLATTAGFTVTWFVLGALGLVGAAVAVRTWPRHDPSLLEHTHHGPIDTEHLADAVQGDDGLWRHSHEFVIDQHHRRWPANVR